jgi:hypothetical protein
MKRKRPAGRPGVFAGRLHALGVLQNSSAYHCRSRHSSPLSKKASFSTAANTGGKQRFLNRPSLYSPAFFRREESLDMRLKLGQGRSIVRGHIAHARTKSNPPVVRVQRYDIDLNVEWKSAKHPTRSSLETKTYLNYLTRTQAVTPMTLAGRMSSPALQTPPQPALTGRSRHSIPPIPATSQSGSARHRHNRARAGDRTTHGRSSVDRPVRR